MKIYFAADHAGFELKNKLVEYARGLGHDVEDCGAHTFDKNDDYPDIIAVATRKLSADALAGKESRAIVLGASGQGEAIVANRFKGVRCALYYGRGGAQEDMSGKSLDIIKGSREHNDANALSIGARFVDAEDAKQVVEEWLAAPFSDEARHTRRIKKIDEL